MEKANSVAPHRTALMLRRFILFRISTVPVRQYDLTDWAEIRLVQFLRGLLGCSYITVECHDYFNAEVEFAFVLYLDITRDCFSGLNTIRSSLTCIIRSVHLISGL